MRSLQGNGLFPKSVKWERATGHTRETERKKKSGFKEYSLKHHKMVLINKALNVFT